MLDTQKNKKKTHSKQSPDRNCCNEFDWNVPIVARRHTRIRFVFAASIPHNFTVFFWFEIPFCVCFRVLLPCARTRHKVERQHTADSDAVTVCRVPLDSHPFHCVSAIFIEVSFLLSFAINFSFVGHLQFQFYSGRRTRRLCPQQKQNNKVIFRFISNRKSKNII